MRRLRSASRSFCSFAQLVPIALHVAVNVLFVKTEEVQLAGVVEEEFGIGEDVAEFAAIVASGAKVLFSIAVTRSRHQAPPAKECWVVLRSAFQD